MNNPKLKRQKLNTSCEVVSYNFNGLKFEVTTTSVPKSVGRLRLIGREKSRGEPMETVCLAQPQAKLGGGQIADWSS